MAELDKGKILSSIDYEFKELELKLDVTPEAYARPRKSRKLEALGKSNIFYNPKSSYKNKLKKIIKQELEELKWEEPVKGEIHLHVYTGIRPPKTISNSKSKLYLASKRILRPLTRPDVDNYAKIILDILNNLIYEDDSQVTCLYSEKFYIDPNIENEKIIIRILYRNNEIKIRRGKPKENE